MEKRSVKVNFQLNFKKSLKSDRYKISSQPKLQSLGKNKYKMNFKNALKSWRSWDSIVGIMTGYGLCNQGVRVQVLAGSRIFSFPCHRDRLWGPPKTYTMGMGGSFPGG
jgi:hypothetical protein